MRSDGVFDPTASLEDDRKISQLMQAAQQGRISEIKPLLDGVSPDIKDRTGRTVFSWAASHDLTRSPHDCHTFENVLQFLLDRGANPNLWDHHGETPMHWATKEGDHQMIELLLQKDVHPDVPDSRGRTPLSRAAEKGHLLVVEVLLTKGRANPDSKDARGRTPLSWAAENWHLETVSMLIDHGASTDAQDREGQIPLWLFLSNTAKRTAMDQQSPSDTGDYLEKWLAILGSNHDVEPMTKARRSFLSWACEKGDKTLVMELLRTDWADPNSIDRYRKTPLIYALEWNHYDISDILISGVGQKRDVISLQIMIQESRSRLLKPFLERYKLNLEEEDGYNSIPMMKIALQQGDRATVTVLLEHQANIQGLDNSDWFGPCSTIQEPFDYVLLNDARTGRDYHSIPLMKMAIQEVDRAAVAHLLDRRAKMLGIEEDRSYSEQHNIRNFTVAVDILAHRGGRKKARWILDDALEREIKNIPRTSEETHLILFRENHLWKTYYQMQHSPNELIFSLGHKSPCRTFTLSIRMNLKIKKTFPSSQIGDDYQSYEEGTIRTIEWAVLEAPPKVIHYFSNLPFGWIPQNDVEFIQLFMQTLRGDWMDFCREARGEVSRLRSHQLTVRGKDDLLIDTVAENMQQWTRIEGTLEEQLSQARNFVSQYQRYSETRRFNEQISETINAMERDISGQIEKLEQAMRDLLQIEFAWVSINEAHRSTSLATSLKRISWITFIFLPLTFASSLFGMNVDLLKGNPSWRWYPLVGGVLLLLTVTAWISSKFINVRAWDERTAQVISRKSRRRPIERDTYTT